MGHLAYLSTIEIFYVRQKLKKNLTKTAAVNVFLELFLNHLHLLQNIGGKIEFERQSDPNEIPQQISNRLNLQCFTELFTQRQSGKDYFEFSSTL